MKLFVFDFDHTLIDENSDMHIQLASKRGIPGEIQDMFDESCWIHYMQAIFKHLHSEGITEKEYKENLNQNPFVPGSIDFLKKINNSDNEAIVISDANSFFISHMLSNAQLTDCFSEVYTNPAKFDQSGCLLLNYYHTQTQCKRSNINLCKGVVMEDHIRKRQSEGISYEYVVYIGDGTNDLCPSLRLGRSDLVFARKDFSLSKKIRALESSMMKATVHEWENFDDIDKVLNL